MTNDEKKVQQALDYALKTIQDHVGDPRLRGRLYDRIEEAKLIHKGSTRD